MAPFTFSRIPARATRACLLTFVVASVAATTSATAAAAPNEDATLSYAAAAGCPDADAFRHRVAARLGYDPFVENAARAIDVRVTAGGKKLTATTRVRVEGKNDLVRTLEDGLEQCDALVTAAATGVASVVDPSRAGTAAPGAQAERAEHAPVANHVASAEPTEAVVKVSDGPGSADAITRIRIHSDWAGSELVRKLGTSYGSGTVNGRYASVTTVHTERVCRAPCTADVPTEGEYVVQAPGMVGRAFSIPPDTKRLEARVKGAPAWPLYLSTYVGVYGGALAFVPGAVLWGINGDSFSFAKPLTVVGGLVLVAGIAGLVFLPRTHVESKEGVNLDANAATKPKEKKSFVLTTQGFVF